MSRRHWCLAAVLIGSAIIGVSAYNPVHEPSREDKAVG